MVEYHFTHSKLKKQLFFAKNLIENAKFQNPARALVSPPPFRRPCFAGSSNGLCVLGTESCHVQKTKLAKCVVPARDKLSPAIDLQATCLFLANYA